MPEFGQCIIGNPFLTAALLPPGTPAYTWSLGRYEPVNAIPLCGAAWISSVAAGSVVLRPARSSAPSVIGPIPPRAPTPTYRLHVGQTIELVEHFGKFGYVLGVDAHYLALEASGLAVGATIRRYLALVPGTTSVEVDLSCYYIQPACLAPSTGFTVKILP